MGLNNSGYLVFDVDIEMEPKTYNTSNSNLWTKVRRVFKDELAEMYRDMRATKFKEENLFNILIGEQIDQIPEALYNEDSERKYINNPTYLHMLHGSRREHMRKWINERLLYLDSQFGYEKNTRESIIIRANKKGPVELKIKTYSPMFVKVRWRNDSTSTELKKVGRNEIVTFVGDLPTETDQEIAIYGAKHIKEIGDISNMKPSSLTLGNATGLTKIECKNSPNLKAIGLGGAAKPLKNLQLIDLTGCSQLGTEASSGGIDVSYCDNLKTLKLQGTKLQSVTFNEKGGNIVEMYLPNSITSLYLNGQYSLKKVEFPNYGNPLTIKGSYVDGSQMINLTIINCPNLVDLGLPNTNTAFESAKNYRGVAIKSQSKDFDISATDYKQAFSLCCFGNLQTLNIENSLLSHKYYEVQSPNIQRMSFSDMPDLQGIIFAGNKSYGGNGGQVYNNIERPPVFEGIAVNQCKNFDTVIMQWSERDSVAFKFKDDFVWDLSKLPLKRFICNIALQNLKKIILPDTIEEFSHSKTVIASAPNGPDGSLGNYTEKMSPLETVVIKGHYEDNFTGIDLADFPLNNVNLNGLTNKVEVIKNINCKAIDLNPRMTNAKQLENIKINLNNYKHNSLNSTFWGTDMSKFTVTLDKKLTTENMDYSYMFQNTKNVRWEDVSWLKNLPPGKMQESFRNCDVLDRLEVGNMIDDSNWNLWYTFNSMPNIKELDLEGGSGSQAAYYYTFANNAKLKTINLTGWKFNNSAAGMGSIFTNNYELEQIIGAEKLIQDQCESVYCMFQGTPKLKFNYPDGKPDWVFGNNVVSTNNFMDNCGSKVKLAENEEYILDLSDCGDLKATTLNCMFRATGFTKIISNIVQGSLNGGTQQSMFAGSPNLKEIQLAEGMILAGDMRNFALNCPKLTTVNMNNADMSKITLFDYPFTGDLDLTDLTFGKGLKVSTDFSNNRQLTKKSLMSIIENIGTANSGATLTLSEDSWNLLSDEDRNIAARKGWTIARG